MSKEERGWMSYCLHSNTNQHEAHVPTSYYVSKQFIHNVIIIDTVPQVFVCVCSFLCMT